MGRSGPQQGRLVSVDPENAGADATSSVSWNGYSYVGNSPLSLTDPSGESWFSVLAGIFIGIFAGPDAGIEADLFFTGFQELANGQPPWAWLGDPLPEASTFTGCGGPLGNCGGLGTNPWSEQSPLGPNVQNPDQFILDFVPGFSLVTEFESLGFFVPLKQACAESGLREVIARGERAGYGTVVHGKVIAAPPEFANLIGTRNAEIADPSTLMGHPNILVQVNPTLQSTAFGRYQILARTAAGLGMTDFSPAGQDAAADTLMARRNMISPAMNGDPIQGILNGGREWASLPGSPYGQPTISMAQGIATYARTIQSCR